MPVVAGFLVSMLGQKEILTWYRTLNKPSWQPPAFLFGETLSNILEMLHWRHISGDVHPHCTPIQSQSYMRSPLAEVLLIDLHRRIVMLDGGSYALRCI